MIRDSKVRLRVFAMRCNVRVEILLFHLSNFLPSSESRSSARTFRGFKSGSISEYPVASAIGRRAESDFAQCSASVSVVGGKTKNQN